MLEELALETCVPIKSNNWVDFVNLWQFYTPCIKILFNNSRYSDRLTSISLPFFIFESPILVLRHVLPLVVGLLPLGLPDLPWQHVSAADSIGPCSDLGVQFSSRFGLAVVVVLA